MRKGVSNNNQKWRSQAQNTHNAKTNVLPINIDIGDYVMVPTHTKPSHKLQAMWRGPMKVVKSKSNLEFTIENIVSHQHHVVHAQRTISYPSTGFGEQALNELKEQAVHYDSSYHLVDDIRGMNKQEKREYEMLVCWLGFEEGKEETWEPVARVMEDMSGILEDFLHSAGQWNLKREIIDFYF